MVSFEDFIFSFECNKMTPIFIRTQSGLHITVGDDMGKIWVYDVGEALAVPGQVIEV